jgi:hypothetical protein
LKAQSLLKEVKAEPDLGLEFVYIDLYNDGIFLYHGDGSLGNVSGNRTQSGYCIYVAESKVLSGEGNGSLIDWRSHRLKRACHCTLLAEAMSSRSGGAQASWCRQMFLEAMFQNYRATLSLEPLQVASAVRGTLVMHGVTDCNSLHECVVKSGLPEDKRAAIEILAIRELVADANADSEGDLDEEGRLRDEHLERVFHWTTSADMKADILTKVTTGMQRRNWMTNVNAIEMHSVKKADLAARRAVPSRPRARLNRDMARKILQSELMLAVPTMAENATPV